MITEYKTINGNSEGLYKDKGSKFLAFAYHVETQEEVKAHLERLRKEYYDARHHCYAWRMGHGGERTRAVDDGEPSSTAGRPILGQITSFELTNIVIFVIRYFGGTLLGTSGLIKAYKEAAADAITAAEIVTREVKTEIKISFPYDKTDAVMRLVKECSAEVKEQIFDLDCKIKLLIKRADESFFISKAEKIENIEFTIINN